MSKTIGNNLVLKYLNILLISSLCLSGLFYEFLGCIFIIGICKFVCCGEMVKFGDINAYVNFHEVAPHFPKV